VVQLQLLLFPLKKTRFAFLILCCCIKECCSYDVLLDLCGVMAMVLLILSLTPMLFTVFVVVPQSFSFHNQSVLDIPFELKYARCRCSFSGCCFLWRKEDFHDWFIVSFDFKVSFVVNTNTVVVTSTIKVEVLFSLHSLSVCLFVTSRSQF